MRRLETNLDTLLRDDRFSVLKQQQSLVKLMPDLYRDPDRVPRKLRDAFNECRKGRSPWPLLVAGSVGIGKTRFCLLVNDYYGGRYDELSILADEFAMVRRGEFRDLRWTTQPKVFERDWLNMMRDERIVIVDDIGRREDESEHVRDTLIRILNSREGGRPLVLVSNLDAETLAKVYGDRIASRMNAGTVMDLAGKDKRTGGRDEA